VERGDDSSVPRSASCIAWISRLPSDLRYSILSVQERLRCGNLDSRITEKGISRSCITKL
jgi:hypothetical protein